MRTARATAAAVTAVIGAGAAAVAVGRLASNAALKAPAGRPLPTEPRLTVHATAAGQITLTRDLASLRPGTYGLSGDGFHAVVGPVLESAPHAAHAVVRRLERVTHGSLESGAKAWLTPQVHIGDPKAALGLDHADIDIPGELGAVPAWFVPGARDTWVITVHGLGTTREHPMVLMDFLHRQRFPVLDLAYRGDLGAPAPRTASATSARRSGATWTPRSATPCATARSASSCTAGRPAPPWHCTRRPIPLCGTASPDSSSTHPSSRGA